MLSEEKINEIAERAAAAGLSGEEVRKAILAGVGDAYRLANEGSTPPPPRPEAPGPQTLGLDLERADTDRLAAAHEASQRAEARRNRANEARALLVEEQVFSQADADDLPDELALEYSGIEPSPEMLRKQEEARLLADPQAQADRDAARKQQEVYDHWWSFHPSERPKRAAEVGLDPEHVNQTLWQREKKARRY